MRNRRKNKMGGFRRAAVSLLAFVMLLSVCFPGFVARAEEIITDAEGFQTAIAALQAEAEALVTASETFPEEKAAAEATAANLAAQIDVATIPDPTVDENGEEVPAETVEGQFLTAEVAAELKASLTNVTATLAEKQTAYDTYVANLDASSEPTETEATETEATETTETEPVCTCTPVNGVHAESCPLYVAPEVDTAAVDALFNTLMAFENYEELSVYMDAMSEDQLALMEAFNEEQTATLKEKITELQPEPPVTLEEPVMYKIPVAVVFSGFPLARSERYTYDGHMGSLYGRYGDSNHLIEKVYAELLAPSDYFDENGSLKSEYNASIEVRYQKETASDGLISYYMVVSYVIKDTKDGTVCYRHEYGDNPSETFQVENYTSDISAQVQEMEKLRVRVTHFDMTDASELTATPHSSKVTIGTGGTGIADRVELNMSKFGQELQLPDPSYLRVEKTFEGIAPPSGFAIDVTSNDHSSYTDLTIDMAKNEGDGKYSWTMAVDPLGTYTVTEKNYEVEGYTCSVTNTKKDYYTENHQTKERDQVSDGPSVSDVRTAENKTSVVSFTNIYEQQATLEPDDAFIQIKKEIAGIESVPENFKIVVGEHELTMGDDLEKTWKLDGLSTGTYTVKESGALVDGYNLKVTVSGVVDTNLSILESGYSVTVAASSAIATTFNTETSNSNSVYSVLEGSYFVGYRNGSNDYIIFTQKPLSAVAQATIEKTIRDNIPSGWHYDDNTKFVFYSISDCEIGKTYHSGNIGVKIKSSTEIEFTAKSVWTKTGTGTYDIKAATNADIVIVNEYSVANTTITLDKDVTGNLGDWSKEFTFNVAVNGVSLEPIKLTHQSEVAKIEVPIGAEVTITESGNEGYTVSATVEGEPVEVVNSAITFTASSPDGHAVVFTNRNEAVIETGFHSNNFAYYLMLSTAIVFAMLLIMGKACQVKKF